MGEMDIHLVRLAHKTPARNVRRTHDAPLSVLHRGTNYSIPKSLTHPIDAPSVSCVPLWRMITVVKAAGSGPIACGNTMHGNKGRQMGTILLVDDDHFLLEGLLITLRNQPHHVLTANSAAEGLERLSQESVDVVVADEVMPGMCGSEFLAIVARRYPDTVSITLTGQATVAAAARAINEGRIFHFLQKPCSPRDFIEVVTAAFDSRTPTAAGSNPLGQGLSSKELAALSARERGVLELLLDGHRISSIATRLHISPHTVRNHLKALFHKLDVHSQSQLIGKCRPRPE